MNTLGLIYLGVMVVYLVILSWGQRADKTQGPRFCVTRDEIIPKATATTILLDLISTKDPIWVQEDLVEHASGIFVKLKNFLHGREYPEMREDLMSPLFEHHQNQLAKLKSDHAVNALVDLEISNIDIVNVRYPKEVVDREFTVLLSATLTTAEVKGVHSDEVTRGAGFVRIPSEPAKGNLVNQQICGASQAIMLQEFWTFQLVNNKWLLRDICQVGEASALSDKNLYEEPTDPHNLASGSYVGETDTQAPPTSVNDNRIVSLLNQLYEDDKLWDKDAMTALASSTFENLHLAMEALSITPELEAQLSPDFLGQLREQMDYWQNAEIAMQCESFRIQSVEITEVHSYDDKSLDEYIAYIIATAETTTISNGIESNEDEDVTRFEVFMKFGRFDDVWRLKEQLDSVE